MNISSHFVPVPDACSSQELDPILSSIPIVQPSLFILTSRLARDSARSRGSTFRGYTGLLKYITEISIL